MKERSKFEPKASKLFSSTPGLHLFSFLYLSPAIEQRREVKRSDAITMLNRAPGEKNSAANRKWLIIIIEF